MAAASAMRVSGGSFGYCLLMVCLLHADFWVGRCASDGECSAEELRALLQFKSGLIDPDNLLSTWRGRHCCQWRGLSCDDLTGSVTSIDLHNPYPDVVDPPRDEVWNLSGRLDASLLQLEFLSRLDLSYNNFDGLRIPDFLGSLKKLRYLNLSNAGFAGAVPSSLGNLSELQHLDLSSPFQPLFAHSLQWATALASLRHLAMPGVDLSRVGSEWVEVLSRLPSLTHLDLRSCGLSGIAHSLPSVDFASLSFVDLSLNTFNSKVPNWFRNLSSLVHLDVSSARLHGLIPIQLSEIPSLRYLDLSMNGNLTVDCSKLLAGSWRRIEVLDLASNQVYGRLPDSVGNISSLVELNLFSNNMEGGIPSSIGKLCNLQVLFLAGNNLTLGLPEHLEKSDDCISPHPLPKLRYLNLAVNLLSGILPEWLGQLRNLESLDLSSNLIGGPIPSSLGKLPLLTDLSLAGNRLNGSLPPSIGQLTKLANLDISSNLLTGTVTHMHLSKLRDLKLLAMGFNSLVINMSSSWNPPFQLRKLVLGSCQLGPQFPSWLKSQKELMYLDLSNSSISGRIPNWFWDLSSNLSLLNISFSQIEGPLPSPLNIDAYADVDLRSNLLSGPLPVLSNFVELLDLSQNRFFGPIPHDFAQLQPSLIYSSLSGNNLSGEIPASIGLIQGLLVVDLSRNNLTGDIPTSLANCSSFKALVLEHNSLTGTIPAALGSLQQLQSLHLNDNMLHGVIPSSMKTMSGLQTLDLGNNRLQGAIPAWIGESFPALRILRLRGNKLSGRIPDQFSNLSSLQVLDLAGNELKGSIPRSIGGLRAMARPKASLYLFYGFYRGSYYEESLSMVMNNRPIMFTKTLTLVTSIDLSDNNLSDEVPQELMTLSGLLVLNLSRNQFTGKVLERMADLHDLLSLDLSNNHFYGSISSSLASMSFLSSLNLSNNNFSGSIPQGGQLGTFGASAYWGNPYLCGRPLSPCAVRTGVHDDDDDEDEESALVDGWFYLSVGLGFAVGLLGLFAVISIRRPWSIAYFNFVDRVIDSITKLIEGVDRVRN